MVVFARVLACHQGAAGWRTDSRPGIALRESNSRFGELVDVRKLDTLTAIAGEVAQSEVIG